MRRSTTLQPNKSQTHFRGTPRVDWMFTLAAAAYDLIRLPKLLAAAA